LTETVEPNRSKYHLTKPRTLSTLTALRAGAEDAEFFYSTKQRSQRPTRSVAAFSAFVVPVEAEQFVA
jgi:hypothetical protein